MRLQSNYLGINQGVLKISLCFGKNSCKRYVATRFKLLQNNIPIIDFFVIFAIFKNFKDNLERFCFTLKRQKKKLSSIQKSIFLFKTSYCFILKQIFKFQKKTRVKKFVQNGPLYMLSQKPIFWFALFTYAHSTLASIQVDIFWI